MRVFAPRLLLPLAALTLFGCPPKKTFPPPPPSGRCEVDLEALGLFSRVGNGASAKQVTDAAQLIGGPYAHGRVGDYLLENDRIRVVVQAPLRTIAPLPYGGTIIDADIQRPAGEAGRDEMGKLGLVYAFGRTPNVKQIDVLADGAQGGYAVIAATGEDAVLDYVNLSNVIDSFLGLGVTLVVDPNKPLPLTATTYYVLSPGETRVRALTAFCNAGTEPIVTQLGEIFEQGGVTEVFNPGGCVNGMGSVDCLIDPSTWYGSQADGVAYGFRSYKFSDRTKPSTNALMYVAGIAITLAEGENQAGVLSWVDPGAARRPGSFGILPAEPRLYLRDFFVGKDLAEVSSTLLTLDSAQRARLSVTAQLDDGSMAPFARVAVVDANTSTQVTLLVTDADGAGRLELPPGNYRLSTGRPGHAHGAEVSVTVPSSGQVSATVKLGASRTLTVAVADPFGAALPAKVTVRCPGGPCTYPPESYRRWYDTEVSPSDYQAIAPVGASGTLALPLPPGTYEVFVTRGPEYSAWPDTFPTRGQVVDLTQADGRVDAVLAHVVDTTGWMNADLHVHAVNSPDSSVPNAKRAAWYAAEGIDVLVSTDHDVITDYAAYVAQLGLASHMATMIGLEVTPFDSGHQNAFPVVRRDSPSGGAFDWAGGDGPSLRLEEIYAGLRADHPGVVIQMNHPRSDTMGSLTTLKVDTATATSHAAPEPFRMTPSGKATATDTGLFSLDFDALEVMNGTAPSLAVMNDWMTFNSRGWLKVATGVSDSHTSATTVGGYGRTWVQVGADAPAQFDAATFATALKARRAVASSGPFLTVTAKKRDAGGTPVGAAVAVGGTLSVAPSASETVELVVDVQAPDWMQFTALEVYSHAPGREAVNGESNTTWPPGRILEARALDPLALPVEAVPGLNGFAARRVHLTETFVVSPTADTWYSVMLRSSAAARTLAPLAWSRVSCSGGVCTAGASRAEAFSNAILIDADGSGAYDDFPLKPGQPLTHRPSAIARPAPRAPTAEEADSLLKRLLRHEH